jgi:hypothetical protein
MLRDARKWLNRPAVFRRGPNFRSRNRPLSRGSGGECLPASIAHVEGDDLMQSAASALAGISSSLPLKRSCANSCSLLTTEAMPVERIWRSKARVFKRFDLADSHNLSIAG